MMIEVTRLEIETPRKWHYRVQVHICFGYVVRHFIYTDEHLGYMRDFKWGESVFLHKAIDVQKFVAYGWSILPPEYIEG